MSKMHYQKRTGECRIQKPLRWFWILIIFHSEKIFCKICRYHPMIQTLSRILIITQKFIIYYLFTQSNWLPNTPNCVENIIFSPVMVFSLLQILLCYFAVSFLTLLLTQFLHCSMVIGLTSYKTLFNHGFSFEILLCYFYFLTDSATNWNTGFLQSAMFSGLNCWWLWLEKITKQIHTPEAQIVCNAIWYIGMWFHGARLQALWHFVLVWDNLQEKPLMWSKFRKRGNSGKCCNASKAL